MPILNARDERERPQIQNKPPTMVVTRQPNRLTIIPVTGPSAKINDSPIDPTHAVGINKGIEIYVRSQTIINLRPVVSTFSERFVPD